jgi:hypothetical protein
VRAADPNNHFPTGWPLPYGRPPLRAVSWSKVAIPTAGLPAGEVCGRLRGRCCGLYGFLVRRSATLGVLQAADRAGQCSGRVTALAALSAPLHVPGAGGNRSDRDCRGRVGRVWWSACDGGLPPPVEYEKIATIQPEAA